MALSMLWTTHCCANRASAGGSDVTAGASLADLRQQFGETIPDLNAMDAAINAATGSGVAASSVPEPTSFNLLFSCLIVVCATSRRGRRPCFAGE